MGMLAIPRAFIPYFGKVPGKITLTTYNGYNYDITTRIVDGEAILDQVGQLFPLPMILGLATS
jgi:hypothetical protein